MIKNNLLFILTTSSLVNLAFPTKAAKPLSRLLTEHHAWEQLDACKVAGPIKRLALMMLLEAGSLRIWAQKSILFISVFVFE